jgi:hypothetical protein
MSSRQATAPRPLDQPRRECDDDDCADHGPNYAAPVELVVVGVPEQPGEDPVAVESTQDLQPTIPLKASFGTRARPMAPHTRPSATAASRLPTSIRPS